MFGAHPMVMLLSGIAYGVIIVASVVMLPVILVRMPADYFVREESSPTLWRQRHPVKWWTLRVLKNLCGLLLLLAGAVTETCASAGNTVGEPSFGPSSDAGMKKASRRNRSGSSSRRPRIAPAPIEIPNACVAS